MFTGGAWAEVDLYERSGLPAGHVIDGPAIVTEELATTVVEPGWQAVVTGRGDLLLSRVAARPDRADVGTTADPVMLEIFNNLFMSVAEQMGVRLQSTAHSVNIKERLDFSCAVFDADGGLIANAPHMPVHLGSMGESIKMVIERNRRPDPPRRRLRPQRPLPRRHPPARHHRRHPRVRPRQRRHLVLRGQPRPPRRDRRGVAGIHAGRQHPGRGGGGADRQLAAGAGPAAAGSRDHRAAEDGRVPVPRPGHQPRRPARPDRRQREGHRRAAQDGAALRPGRGARLHGARTGERGRVGAAGDHRAARRRVRLRTRQRRGGPGGGPGRPGGPDRRDRLHRHLAAAARQLQRAVERGHGGGALRVPHPGRRRHPAQLGLPAAAARDHPAGHDALPGVPGRGGGGQRGDLPGRHRGALRRPRRDGRGVRDDEQRDVRQRQVPVLRDGGQRVGRGRRLRRHRRGADQDDELQAHRPRGAGVALPGAARVVPDQAGQRRRRPLARRPRRRPQAPLRRADDRHHADRPPPRPRLRPGRRRAGRARPALDRAPGRPGDRRWTAATRYPSRPATCSSSRPPAAADTAERARFPAPA